MALTNAFENVRGKAIAGGLAAMMTLAALGGAAHAQDLAANTTGIKATPISTGTDATAVPRGKDVLLRVGPGFSPTAARSLSKNLSEAGCPTTTTTERGFPGHVTVEIDGDGSKFTQSLSAGASALRRCLDQS